MRTRTLLAGVTLAALTVVWSAPAALAQTASARPVQNSAAITALAPNDDDGDNPGGGQGDKGRKQQPDPSVVPQPKSEPKPKPEPKTESEPKSDTPNPPPVGQQRSDVIAPGPILADPKAILSLARDEVRPGDDVGIRSSCNPGQPSLTGDGVDLSSGRVPDNAAEGSHTITLTCVNGTKRDTATARFTVHRGPDGPPNGPGNPPGIAPGEPNPNGPDRVRARLAVSPHVVRQGDTIDFNDACDNGRRVSLDADGVQVRGDHGWVDDNAREGDHTATLTCEGRGGRDTATDRFRVIRDDHNPGPGQWDGPRDFWLSDRSGYRNDNVDVSVRCRDDRAQLESDALVDITLHRDGDRLTGTTHVENGASNGWHRVTVRCDGHSEDRGFWVLRDRGDRDRYLDVDPGYGHRGDDIDIHVGCDRPVGRVESDALDDVDLSRDSDSWRWHADTHVSDDADPGEHTVRVKCGDDTLEETFFVKDGDGHDSNGDGNRDDGRAEGGDQTSVYPVGAPETGGGPLPGDDSTPDGLVALGVLGVTGLALAGTGVALARRNAQEESR